MEQTLVTSLTSLILPYISRTLDWGPEVLAYSPGGLSVELLQTPIPKLPLPSIRLFLVTKVPFIASHFVAKSWNKTVPEQCCCFSSILEILSKQQPIYHEKVLFDLFNAFLSVGCSQYYKNYSNATLNTHFSLKSKKLLTFICK